MVTFKDLITGDISDSPSDRLAAPFLLFLTFPVVIPCSVVYHSAKGIKALGEVIQDKIDERNYYKEVERIEKEQMLAASKEVIDSDSQEITSTNTNKPKVLSLKMNNNNKKQM